MQNQLAKSNSIFISKYFRKLIRSFEINILLLLTASLFSISGSAQLALENFNSGLPSTWAVTSNQSVSNNWSATAPTAGYLGTPGVSVNPALNATVGTRAEYFLITPRFNTPTPPTEIRFFTKQGSFLDKGTLYELRLSTANQPDTDSFSVVLASWTEAQLNVSATTFEEKIITIPSLPQGLPIYLAFVAITNQTGTSATEGDTWFVDNVRVITSCSLVTGITSNMSANGGQINWMHPFATDFEIQILPQGTGRGTSGTPVSGLSYTATGLNNGTNYDVYIKTVCDATTASGWAGPFSIKTAKLGLECTTPIEIPTTIVSTPYVLSTNLNTFYNNQSYTPLDSRTLSCQPAGATFNYLGGDHAFLTYTPATTGLINITQAVTVDSAVNCFNASSGVYIFDKCPTDPTANCLGAIVTGLVSGVNSGQLNNFYAEVGKTYFFVISSPYPYSPTNNGASVCFTFSVSAPTCSIPSDLSYSSLAQTSVNFSWTNPQNLVSNWQYLVKLASDGIPTSSDVFTATNSNNSNLVSGLVPNTKYNFFVRSVCDGTPGSWSSPLVFTTLCTAFSPPYYTGFTGATPALPEPCWTSFDLNKDNVFFTYANDPTGGAPQGQIARLFTSNSRSQTNDMLCSPQVFFDGVTQKRLRFKFKGFGGYTNSTGYVLGESTYMIKLSTTGVGVDNYTTVLAPIETFETGNNWVERIIPIPADITGNISIAWYLPPGYPNTATNFYIDDVYIEDLPACSSPIYPGVTANSITTNSAQFYWTNGYNNSQWEIVVQPLGSGIPTISGDIVNSNPYTKTGLIHSTRYEFYIRTYCSSLLQSEWIGPILFNTLCDDQPLPYFESLNDTDVTTKKFCWSVINRNNDAAEWIIEDTQASIRPQGRPFTPFEQYDDFLVTARVNVVGQKMIKFKYRAASTIFFPNARGNFELLMSSTPDFVTYTVLIPSHDFTNNQYMEDFVIFNGIGPSYFAFRVPPTMNNPSNTGIVMIDDFSIEDAPACPVPTDLNVSNITSNTANLTWTKGLVETQWELVIQSPLSGIPSVSGLVVTGNSNYLATALNPDTMYEFYVRAVCTSESSDWVGPFKFKTTCTVLPTPFIETFDSDSQTESCWTVINNNENAHFWQLNQPANPIFGDQMAAMFSGTNGNNDDWLISPTLAVQPNQRLRFFYKVYNSFFEEDLKIKLSTNGVDLSQFTTVLFDTDVSGKIKNEEVRELVIDLTSITSPTNVNIAFHIPFYPPNPWNYRGQYLFIDNVIVESIPSCSNVINVSTSNLSDTSVQVNWENSGTGNSWEISIQPFGTAAPTGNTLPEYLRTTLTKPFTISGLTPSTSYQFYIRTICANGQSEWVGPFNFVTTCNLSNSCQYKITLDNGTTGRVTTQINLMQNGQLVQPLFFQNSSPFEYEVFLCRGVEFSLFWSGTGSGIQYSNAQITIRDNSDNVVWTSPRGLGTINTTIFSGVSICGTVSCPQPTNLTANNQGVLSWTPGGSETQWEVFIQPLGNTTLPQSGKIVDTPSFIPLASDFPNASSGTVEFFVRAICSDSDKSFWTGPKVFIRNDEPNNAIRLEVNLNDTCIKKSTNASFIGATASSIASTCGGVNGGDIWYEFIATSNVHTIELSNFNPGSYYASSYQGVWPKIMLSLFEVQSDNSLAPIVCSNNNSLVMMYSSELTIGNTYKIRIILDDTMSNDKKFDICLSTPTDVCNMNAFNFSFEKLPMQTITGLSSIINARVVPGWRVNTETGTMFFQEASNSPGIYPYEGAQCIQLIHDNVATWNPNDPNIKGLYKDFDTYEITQMDYSFASATRTNGSTIELWAGPPSGPFTLVKEHTTNTLVWSLVQGSYTIPQGQTTTRFIFRTRGYLNGHLLDAANFKANTKIKASSKNLTLACNQTSAVVEAFGVGQWSADPNNPAVTIISNSSSSTATISGFAISGTYVFYWKTRYCEESLTVTYNGLSSTPTVDSPVAYCQNQLASALTANAPSGFTLLWFTEAIGGIGSTTAIVPSTEIVGTTTYYVALVDVNGCVGPRLPIVVTINPLITPVVAFSYGSQNYCTTDTTPVINFASGFSTEGTFTVSPSTGLSIDSRTGIINLASSTQGSYQITYTVPALGCRVMASHNFTLEVNSPVDFNLISSCESQNMFVAVEANGVPISNVVFEWYDANNNLIATNASSFNVTNYINQNTLSFPTFITAKSINGACVISKSFPIEGNECSLIPRGISPNNDGDNDSFNLAGLGARQVTIFNRYGKVVYSFSGNYIDQWKGTTNKGEKLADGTYFYSITFDNGKSVTGWVYINGQY